MTYKLGSLFDGSGGFPLSGALCGIEPCWAAEVEPYPIAVTRTRFPNMRHLGDISKVNGAEIEPVDVITFGSPCQDLSVAGKRAGLKHEANGDDETTRSGLFMEAVRIIKEMRKATNGMYPRYALWENVPGAFSSNKGEDFRIVCEELIKIVEPLASMPPVPQNGWNYADSYIGDGWSLAYRVFDAQYWGVPQRRRRIHLIADFRGTSAQEVLFEREGVRGYFTEGRTPWQATPEDAQEGPGATDREGESQGADGGRQLAPVISVDQGGGKSGAHHYEELAPTLTCTHGGEPAVAYTLKIRGGVAVDSNGKGAGKGALIQEDKSATLGCNQDQYLFQPMPASGKDAIVEPVAIHQHAQSDSWTLEKENIVQTLPAAMGMGGGHGPLIMDPKPDTFIIDNIGGQAEYGKASEVNGTLRAGGQGAVAFPTAPTIGLNGAENVSPTLISRMSSAVGTTQDNLVVCEPAPVFGLSREIFNCGENFNSSLSISEDGVNHTLVARGPTAVCYPTEMHYIVRRLTPTECARLQGFADRWGDIEVKDSLTDEEYRFWLEVRNTHARINGRAEKDYSPSAMLTWYNKLQTDSAEYKMWGNGIALPPALYCMQGIVDVLNVEEDDSWLM